MSEEMEVSAKVIVAEPEPALPDNPNILYIRAPIVGNVPMEFLEVTGPDAVRLGPVIVSAIQQIVRDEIHEMFGWDKSKVIECKTPQEVIEPLAPIPT